MTEKVLGKTTQNIRKKYSFSQDARDGFAVGFAAGQAEKVHLDVCRAAMFRPGADHYEWYLEEVKCIADNYGLKISVFKVDLVETPYEIWIHKEPIGDWLQFEVNSPEWHHARAKACGIPESRVDINYHLREGYGKRCD